MAAFLSDEWFEMALAQAHELPPAPGVALRLGYVVSGAPKGKVQFVAEVVEGQLTTLERAKPQSVDCTVQCSYDLARRLLDASADHDVAFMRGDLKLDGDYAAYLLRFVPWLASDATDGVRRAVAAATDD